MGWSPPPVVGSRNRVRAVCPASRRPQPTTAPSPSVSPVCSVHCPAVPVSFVMGEEEEVQEAEEPGARKRKRVVGVGGEEKEGVCDKDMLLGDDDDDDGARYEGVTEEAVAEVMRWLEAEISPAPDPAAGFVTINGNEESCGPSFSAAASTVMASVDTRAGAPPPPSVPWPWPEHQQPHPLPLHDLHSSAGSADDGTRRKDADVEMVGSGGGGEADEEWLARLLTCGGPLLEGVL